MKYLDLTFVCRFRDEALLPAWKGSTLRGALGSGLLRSLCLSRGETCETCLLRESCLFRRLFVGLNAPAGEPSPPPPFCLTPPRDERRRYAAGEILRFGLKLFSYAVDFLAYFARAVLVAGELGLGESRAQFDLMEILADDSSVYDANSRRLASPDPLELKFPRPENNPASREISVELITPLRFKSANHLAPSLAPNVLILLVLRRLRALALLDGGEYILDPAAKASFDFLRASAKLKTAFLAWKDLSRYSSRQRAAMRVGGLIGRIDFSASAAILPWLRFAAIARLGKQTGFGLGEIAFSAMDA